MNAVHDQVSDCYGSVNSATWCKFATSGVSPDETAKKFRDKSNVASAQAFRGQDHVRKAQEIREMIAEVAVRLSELGQHMLRTSIAGRLGRPHY